MNSYLLISILAGIAIALLSEVWIYYKILKVAVVKNLIDKPNERKLQKMPIPVAGGLAVFFGTQVGLLVASACFAVLGQGTAYTGNISIVCAMSMMLYAGALDDIIGLTPRSRIIVEVAAILGVVFSSGMCIDTFRGMWGIEEFSWWIAVPLTVFAGVGIINAINMIDGVNGLSSGLCICCSLVYGMLFVQSGDIINGMLAFSLSGALFAFFIHNVFGLTSRMFIGDSGTMVMGLLQFWFVLASLSNQGNIRLCLNYQEVNYIALSLSILSVPVFDALRVIFMRLAHGKNPMKADRTHLHHILVSLGVSHFVTAMFEIMICVCITTVWAVSVISGASVEEQLYIVILLSVILIWGIYSFCCYHIKHRTRFLHAVTHYSELTHMGRRRWWKAISRRLDGIGDYLTYYKEMIDTTSQEGGNPAASDRSGSKRQEITLVMDFMRGKVEVHVNDLIAYSGVKNTSVHDIVRDLIQNGEAIVIKADTTGEPVIIALAGKI